MPSLTVVINEVATRGPGGAGKPRVLDEFIELRNISSGTQNIGGWRLEACPANGAPPVLLATINAGTVMQPKGAASGQFYLVANLDGYTGATAADQTYTGVSIEDLGGVRLVNPTQPVEALQEVDAVGFSLGLDCTEVAPAEAQTEAEDPQALASSRDVDSTDTDVNAIDFRKLPRSPRNRFS